MSQRYLMTDQTGQQWEVIYQEKPKFAGELGSGAYGGVSGTLSSGAGGGVSGTFSNPPRVYGSASGTITPTPRAYGSVAGELPVIQTKTINLVGAGTLKTYSEPTGLETLIYQQLTQNGFAINEVKLNNAVDITDKTQWLRFVSPAGIFLPTWNYFMKISVEMLVGHNPEQIRQIVGNNLNQYFKDVNLRIVDPSPSDPASSLFSGGSNWNLFGSGSGSGSGLGLQGDFLGNLGKSMGVTTPVVAAGLLVLAVVVLRR